MVPEYDMKNRIPVVIATDLFPCISFLYYRKMTCTLWERLGNSSQECGRLEIVVRYLPVLVSGSLILNGKRVMTVTGDKHEWMVTGASGGRARLEFSRFSYGLRCGKVCIRSGDFTLTVKIPLFEMNPNVAVVMCDALQVSGRLRLSAVSNSVLHGEPFPPPNWNLLQGFEDVELPGSADGELIAGALASLLVFCPPYFCTE